jgi:glycosyltransferase involved in cell wall biosynthesis
MQIAGRAGDGSCGVADHTFHLSCALAKSAEVVLVHRAGSEPLAEYRKTEGCERVEMLPLSGFESGRLNELIALINDREPDIVHLQYPAAEYRFSLLPVKLVRSRAKFKRAALVVTLHEYHAAHPLRRAAARTLLSAADACILPSTRDFAQLARTKWKRKLHQIPDGNFFGLVLEGEETAAYCNRVPAVCYFGLPSKTKDAKWLLELFAELSRAVPELKLKLIGGVSPRGVAALARRMGLEGRVESTGFLPLPELRAQVEHTLLAAFPFSFDTHRSSLINALSFRTPIVCADVEPEVRRAYAPDLPMHVAQPQNTKEITMVQDYLKAAMSDFAQAAAGHLAAQRNLAGKLAMSEIAAAHLAVYNQMLDARHA